MFNEWFPALIEQYGTPAASLASEVFAQECAELGIAPKLSTVNIVEYKRAAARGGWALTQANVYGNIALIIDELVKQPYRDTIIQSSNRSGIRWVRVPRGEKTCAFCMLLASRGAPSLLDGSNWQEQRYRTMESAIFKKGTNEKFHGDCDCEPVPVRGPADLPNTYDFERAYRKYRGAFSAAKEKTGKKSPSLKDVLAQLRARENLAH